MSMQRIAAYKALCGWPLPTPPAPSLPFLAYHLSFNHMELFFLASAFTNVCLEHSSCPPHPSSGLLQLTL